jgi:hypothetical protein
VAVPYGGWFAGARRIPQLVNLANKISKIEKSPFLSGAAREAVMLTPFEVGRVGVSQVLPWSDESAVDMTSAALFDLALGSGAGGLIHSIAEAGKRAVRTKIPGLDLAAPPPIQLRRMKQMLAEHEAKGGVLTPEQQGAVVNRIKDMDQQARIEKADKGDYLSKVNNNEALTRHLNSFFSVGGPGMLQKKWFAVGENGFPDEASWRQAAKYNFLPDNFAETGRYFRELTFKATGRSEEVAADLRKDLEDMLSGKTTLDDLARLAERKVKEDSAANRAAKVDKQIREGMQSLGFGWLMGKEENGLYVIAKKTRGQFGKGDASDRWVIFKTDMPGTYLPKHKAWSDKMMESNSWQTASQPLEGIGGPYGGMRDFQRQFGKEVIETIDTPGKIKALLPKNLGRASSEVVKMVSDGAREYLAPRAAQMRKSALGFQTLMTAKFGHDIADTMAHEIVFGKIAPDAKNAFRQAVSPSKIDPDVDSISSIFSGLSDDQVNEVVKLRNELVDPAGPAYDALIAGGTLSSAARQAADRLEVLADVMNLDHQKLAQFLGKPGGERAIGDLGLGRKWEGDARIALRDESGKVVSVVSGKTKKRAQETAARVVRENPGLHIAEQIDVSKMKGMDKAALAAIPAEIKATIGGGGTPGLRGFKGDYEVIDRKELLKDFQEAYASKLKWQARMGEEDLLSQSISLLSETDPTTARILSDRLRDLRGEPSKFAQWQNDFTDQALAPIIGPNSASKIVSATNQGLIQWHLGMGNLAFPIMNLFSFATNLIPEMAMVIGASTKDLSGLYTYFLAGGTKGPVAAGALLSPLKVMYKSIREMMNPSEQMQRFYARGAADSTTQPRVAEEYAGQNATKVQDLKEAFSGVAGFAGWTRALSEWLMTNSERMSRIHAFTASYVMGRDVLGIVDEGKLYQFTKEMTDRSMFNYTTADRPRIFTTPAGSAVGLFKTWMMNYMAMMLEYSGQAVKGNVAPLFWQTAGTAAVGGVAATPLYWIADGFSRAFTDKDLLQQTYDNLSEGPADALMFGMPAALTGISLYSQSSTPFSNPQRDASMLWSMVLMNRAEALGRVAGLAIDNWRATGQHPGSSAAVRDAMIQALAPSTVARAVSAFSGEDMIRSLASGYPLVSSMTISDRIAYAVKLNPVEMDRAMAVADTLYRDRAAMDAEVKRLGRAFVEAQDNGDSAGMSEIIKQAMVDGVDPSRVLDSAVNRMKLADEPLIERTFKPMNVAPYQAVLGQ